MVFLANQGKLAVKTLPTQRFTKSPTGKPRPHYDDVIRGP
jgi:hypothetical protein